MKASDLRQLTPEELAARMNDLTDEYFNLRIKHSTGQLENSAALRTARRDLARAHTVTAEKERAK